VGHSGGAGGAAPRGRLGHASANALTDAVVGAGSSHQGGLRDRWVAVARRPRRDPHSVSTKNRLITVAVVIVVLLIGVSVAMDVSTVGEGLLLAGFTAFAGAMIATGGIGGGDGWFGGNGGNGGNGG
jgi:hypothetical protein